MKSKDWPFICWVCAEDLGLDRIDFLLKARISAEIPWEFPDDMIVLPLPHLSIQPPLLCLHEIRHTLRVQNDSLRNPPTERDTLAVGYQYPH